VRSLHDAHPALADPLDDAVLPEQVADVDEHDCFFSTIAAELIVG
jgi:hypothetical protein